MTQKNYSSTELALAQNIFNYLYLSSNHLPPADVVIGFGHFDLRIPRRCGVLYQNGYAKRIIFTGGIGSGTADLGQAEAVAFADELQKVYPSLPEKTVIIEDRSTNTGENIQFTIRKLIASYPDFTFNNPIKKAIIVANSYRQRRVYLTCLQNLPDVDFYNAPPETTFQTELTLFAGKGFDLVMLLVGEIERIVKYGQKGYLVPAQIPQNIYQECKFLKQAGYKTP